MAETIWSLRMVFTSVNLMLLFMLISLYVNEYKKVNSPFTLGFLLFVVALFFRTFFSSPVIDLIFYDVRKVSPVDSYKIFADLSEFIALIILVYFSTREET